jgi:hypothetical protein
VVAESPTLTIQGNAGGTLPGPVVIRKSERFFVNALVWVMCAAMLTALALFFVPFSGGDSIDLDGAIGGAVFTVLFVMPMALAVAIGEQFALAGVTRRARVLLKLAKGLLRCIFLGVLCLIVLAIVASTFGCAGGM